MKVELLSYTPDTEKIVAAAARICYSKAGANDLFGGMDEEKAASYVEMVAGLGHESVIEHASFTFGIEGVSRSLLAQITRHRLASFSVRSQRYVNESGFEYIVPPAVEKNAEAKVEFLAAMDDSRRHYQKISQILAASGKAELLAAGTEEEQAARASSKAANEDARFVLPNACETKLMMTMNCRSLMNFFRLRCCGRAQWEIRALATEMLRLVYQAAPHIFKNAGPGCLCGDCPEGKMSCGRAKQVREAFSALKAREDACRKDA